MELDELKQQLSKQIGSAQYERSVSDITSLLRKDTVSVVQKIKRSLWIELVFSIAFTIGSAFAVAYSTVWAYKTYFSIFIFAGIAFASVLFLLLKRTNKLSNADAVKINLQLLILVLKEYVKRYLQLEMILLPACFGFAYWLSYNDPTKVIKPFRWDLFGSLAVYLLVAGIAIYYFSKWYLKKLYGNYITRLEELLNEVDGQ